MTDQLCDGCERTRPCVSIGEEVLCGECIVFRTNEHEKAKPPAPALSDEERTQLKAAARLLREVTEGPDPHSDGLINFLHNLASREQGRGDGLRERLKAEVEMRREQAAEYRNRAVRAGHIAAENWLSRGRDIGSHSTWSDRTSYDAGDEMKGGSE